MLVLKNQIIGVIQRFPAHVIGDGIHNIEQLIEKTNHQRQTISDTLGPITVDEECQIRLNELGIELTHIPNKDQSITLGYTSNATRGGTYKSLPTKVCMQNHTLFIRAASELNLDLVGFDVQCADINEPLELSRGVIIEANDGPSVRIHEYPMEGPPSRVSKKILRTLIYRHPFSYLYTLYKNKRTALYIRSLILAGIAGAMYCIIQ